MKRLRNRQRTQNRLMLIIIGIVLAVGGLLALLLASDRIDQITEWADGHTPLLNAQLDAALADHQIAFQLVALGVAVLLIALGATWLSAQIPRIRKHQDQIFESSASTIGGANVVAGGALAAVIEDDIERHSDIDRARVELRTDDELIRIRVSSSELLPVPELDRVVIGPAVERAVTVGEISPAPKVLTDVRFVAASRQLD